MRIVDGVIDREKALMVWLLGEPKNQEFEAALNFLETNGDSEDLSIVQKIFDKVATGNKNTVAIAIVAMLAKKNLSAAFKRLIELDPDPIGEFAAGLLFSRPDAIPTETAERCLPLKADIIRRNAATLLNSRQALDTTTAARLMTDSDPEVRLVAVFALMRQGQTPQEDTIKRALLRPKSRGLLGMGMGADDSYYARYRESRLSQLHYKDLRERTDACDILDVIEIKTLAQRFTRKFLPEIRCNIGDGFKQYFDDKLGHLVSEYGYDDKIIASTNDLEEFLRKRLTTITLDALCEYSNSADLQLVRKTLDKHEVDFSESVLRFLGHFGDWSDRDRILSFIERYSSTDTLLYIGSDKRAKPIAAALYAIGNRTCGRPIHAQH